MYGLIDRVIVERSNEKYISELTELIVHVEDHLPSELSTVVLDNLRTIDAAINNPKAARLNAQLAKNHFLGIKVNESSKFWSDYVRRELAQQGGKLFKWISNEEKQFLSVNLSAMMPHSISLNKFVQDQANTWSKLWFPSERSSGSTAQAFTDLWHKAREIRNRENKPLKEYFDDKVFYDSITKYKKNSLGSDLWSAKGDLANLPFIALGEISDALKDQAKSCVVPHQLLLNFNAILGKKDGCRTISKTPMLWRMFCKCDTQVRQWEENQAGPFDKAVKGSSALSAALLRNLLAEIAVLLDYFAGGLFNDYMIFLTLLNLPPLLTGPPRSISPSPICLSFWPNTWHPE